MAPPARTNNAKTVTLMALVVQPQQESDDEHNPFAECDENPIIIIEQGFKFELPEFHGEQSAEELLDWMIRVEDTLEFKHVPLERCVPMIAMGFRGRAAAWWSQLKASRARLGKSRILSWDKLKKKMRKTFIPFNYDQMMFQRLYRLRQYDRSVETYYTEFFFALAPADLQESDQQIVARFVCGLRGGIRRDLNLLNPLTLAEAHQQALIVEAKNTEDFWRDVWWRGDIGIR